MKFLVDRCAGHRLAEWLRRKGYDVVESRERGSDPGDRKLLGWAAQEGRILLTIDTDFGELVVVESIPHGGLVRFPDVPASVRIKLMDQLLKDYTQEFETGAIITIRSGRIRISRWPV